MTPVAAPLRVAVASGPRPKERSVPPAAIRKIVLQTSTADDADAIHALITDHLAEGHLLPRTRDEIVVRADRLVVARHGRRILACAELAPLSRSVAEVRSLVVGRAARNAGVGRRIVSELLRRAEAAGFEQLCAFTHTPAYFVHMGFSIVPHVWLPEKIVTDCHSCRHFRQCGQYAVVHHLGRFRHSCVPLTALHG
jgi:N-acetylglutamate synthase-like GNAT family acetyltransferase